MSTVAYDPSLQATRSRLLADKVIAVTGASSGIGAEPARVFACEGATVVLGAIVNSSSVGGLRGGTGLVDRA